MVRKSKAGDPNPFWTLGNKSYKDPWVEAIAAIDNDGDGAPLIEMLRSDADLDATTRFHLADFFDRKQFRNKKTPRTPSYATTWAEDVWTTAAAAVSVLMANGADEKTALEKVSKSHRLDQSTLADARNGRLGLLQRAARRKPKAP